MLEPANCHILFKDIPFKRSNICLLPKLNKLGFRDIQPSPQAVAFEFEWELTHGDLKEGNRASVSRSLLVFKKGIARTLLHTVYDN